MAPHTLAFLLLLPVALIDARPAQLLDANVTHHLDRRQCVPKPGRRPGSNEFDCDFQLPSAAQIVEHMRNPVKGKGIADRYAVFYSNLAYPGKYDPSLTKWVGGWLLKKGMYEDGREQFYWAIDPVDPTWLKAQSKYIDEHKDEFRAAYPDSFLNTIPKGQNVDGPAAMLNGCYFQALGAAAINPVAYIFAPKVAQPWDPQSVWARVEYPALTANKNIKEVYLIDPQPLWYKKKNRDPDAAKGPVQPPPFERPDPTCDKPELPDEPTLLWSRERGDPEIPFAWGPCPVGTDIWPLKDPSQQQPPQDEPGQNEPPQNETPQKHPPQD
ncbi:uncharacterized protein AB675_3952 [Cyphellophora attinorum]|uniref:Uncharacterized protein n=1 Tax=Cyphellophora attinorum TaxID=1664694 RepID=A0A0N1H110_9EURO|nr:uncharacterized protein AB675_3952 [Phialophora attinorum]KPI37626.1 hypothetical protein AB675_3952 [Phialophora attinorum]